jgi:L-lactate oxidase
MDQHREEIRMVITEHHVSRADDRASAELPKAVASRALSLISLERLEQEVKAGWSEGQVAWAGPKGDGWTYAENRRAFNDFPIVPRRLQGLGEKLPEVRTRLLDHELTLPIIASPIGSQGIINSDAELVTAEGTGLTGTLYVASGASTKPMEAIANVTPGPKWFQIYLNKDEGINRWLVQRAKAAGFSAIVLTADAVGPGVSDEFIRLGRPRPAHLTFGNHDPALGGRGDVLNQKLGLSFSDISFLKGISGLPVIVKGIQHAEDVAECLVAGAAAVWVSNHGGRQLDGVPATISVLREICDAVSGRVPVILDSGVRRGIDVIRWLALGATTVAIGRPLLWGSAAGGAFGVKSVFDHLRHEIQWAMVLTGVSRISDLERTHVRFPPSKATSPSSK